MNSKLFQYISPLLGNGRFCKYGAQVLVAIIVALSLGIYDYGYAVSTGCSETMPKVGISNGKLMPCPKTPNCVNSQATDDEHFIQSIRFFGSQQEAQSALLKLLEAWKRTKTIVVDEDYIRAEFTSLVFRFIDDVEFYLLSTKAGETTIHVRSASRIGYSDFGVNRKRIEQIRSQLK